MPGQEVKSALRFTCSGWRGGSRGQQSAGEAGGAGVKGGLLVSSLLFALPCFAFHVGGESLLCKLDDSMENVRMEMLGSRGWNPGEARHLMKQSMTLGRLGRRQKGGYDYQGQGNQVPARVPLTLGELSVTGLSPGKPMAMGGPEPLDPSSCGWALLSAWLGLFHFGLFQVQSSAPSLVSGISTHIKHF